MKKIYHFIISNGTMMHPCAIIFKKLILPGHKVFQMAYGIIMVWSNLAILTLECMGIIAFFLLHALRLKSSMRQNISILNLKQIQLHVL